MKTALTQLIERLDEIQSKLEPNTREYNFYTAVKVMAKELIPVEKEIIEEVYNDGIHDAQIIIKPKENDIIRWTDRYYEDNFLDEN